MADRHGDQPGDKPPVGAHPVRDALAFAAIKTRSFRAPPAPELLSLCVAKEKDNQRERPPRLALAGHRATAPALPQLGHPCPRLPGKSVSRSRAFRTGILPVRKGVDIPVDSRCAACRPRLTAAQGPRVEQRAILARTRYATAARLQEQKASSGGRSFDWGESLLSARSGRLASTNDRRSSWPGRRRVSGATPGRYCSR